jgi:1-acyl-sn-glycerol-3-phosphate acyltransferase
MLPPDLPPVSNKALYAYRVFAKWLSFFIFGLGSLIIGVFILPVMRLVFHPQEQFQKHGRRFMSVVLRFFVFIMHSLKIVNLEPDKRENYQHLSSKIVVANHPSLLDVVMLISLIPNADCIVNAGLNQGILRGVIRQLYIPGSREAVDIFQDCSESLKQGNCLIIFPEGSRTPRVGKIILKKGAARVALITGYSIVPVHIGGTDKYGLGKKDPWTGFNPRERYIYRISMGAEINPDKYRHLPAPAAAKSLTREMANVLYAK